MSKSIDEFLKDTALEDDVTIANIKLNQISYKICYMHQLADIKKYNFEVRPYINEENYQNLATIFGGIIKPITDLSKSNLEYLLYSGNILLLFVDNNLFYSLEYAQKPKRSITDSILDPEDPMTSRDGLIEDLSDNLTLLKRRLKTNNLQVKKYQLGLISKCDCAIVYMKNFYDKLTLDMVLSKIQNYKPDIVTSISDISVLYQDKGLLPQIFSTSSPEIIADALIKGRIAILLDNSPIALIVPATLSTFTTSKSYKNMPKYYTIFNHLFISVFFLFAIFFMGLFIAIINFHRDILSNALLANIQITERGTNWPMFVEVIIVYLLFEFYRFSTSRSTNNYIQNIIVILGGLFIGQNAIQSGTIGAIILFLTSISYLAVFAITTNNYLITSINIFRFFILILSFTMGLFGFIISSLIVLFYMFKQKNDGTYYLYPFIPFDLKKFKQYFMPNNQMEKVTK
jgi:bacillus/clostridium gerA spore germination protein